MSGGERHGFPGNHPFRGLIERNQMRFGTAATAETESREGEGGAHEAEEVAAGKGILLPLGRAGGKFAVEPFLEVRRLGVLAQAAPVGAAVGGSGGMVEDALHR